ncbi:actin-related protein 2/3 complex subunit 3 [Eurytemora carolleeae]|uniref:actin-related protein 2/3 complex subunit 3 n=1 Tax=Eurytemora carolleeae TaxID=1294199 RepID=UPI000C782AE8|nr:actin-related protein 2/3 complex subunit 3 [Eurytemora carolleeae]|eukprot:XP_023338179.1 actin-related protein 2/3 complex subunit 3-like [Eurytemora affinis]
MKRMPAYHPTIPSTENKIGGLALLPLRQTAKGSERGPAPLTTNEDIVDQSLDLFKANIFFKNFEFESSEDRVLVYLTLYIVECLKRLQKCSSKEKGLQEMYSFALEQFSLPGDSRFPLNAFFTKPKK